MRRHGVVGVQGRQHEVAGQRRAQRELCGLGVADLADEDDVGVLAQHGAQPAGERHARRGSWTCTWVIPGSWISTGSSSVTTFRSGVMGLAAAPRTGCWSCPSPSAR